MAEGLRIPITVDFKNSLQKLNEARKAITDFGNGAEKSLSVIGTSASSAASALTPLAQAAASAKTAIIAFGEGKGNIETVIPLFQELVAQAGGIDQAFEQLQDIPFFEEFVRGAEEAVLAAERLDGKDVNINLSTDGVENIKTELRQARAELDKAVALFGELSPEADAAAKKVAELNDVIEGSGRLAKGADLKGKFELAGRAIAGVASAFQTVTALQAVFGKESKKTEEALKKVQAVMALTQGIEGVVAGARALTLLAASGAKAFVSLVAGIVAATGATAALATAIAATGIGLLLVGIGLAVDALIKYFNSTSSAQQAIDGLTDAEKRAADAIDFTNKKIQEREDLLNFTTELAVLEARIAGKSQQDIAQIEEAGRRIRIGNAQRDLAEAEKTRKAELEKAGKLLEKARKKGDEDEIKTAREKYDKILADQDKFVEERSKALTKAEQDDQIAIAKNNADAADKRRKELKDKQDEILKVQENLTRRLKDIEFNILIGNIEDGGLEQQLQAFQEAAKQYLKLGFSLDSEQLKNLLQQIGQLRVSLFKPIKIKSKFELELEELENKDAVKKQVEQKLARFRELKPILPTELQAPVFIRTEIVPPPPDSLKNARESILEDQEAFQEKYTALVESGLEDAFEAFGTAIGEGEDPFAALAKSIGLSLANFVTSLGKDMVVLGKLFEALRKALNKIVPPGAKIAVGLALIAFGAAIRGAINKKSENKFASGGFVDGPGTDTSDSIPARLSKGEYVIKARSVRRYGKSIMDKINKGEVPLASLARAVDPSRAIVNRSQSDLEAILKTRSRAIVNRGEEIQLFSEGGLVTDTGRGTSRAIVNRSIPDFIPYDFSRAIVNRPAPNVPQSTEPEIIATTKVSGQDLKIILERANKRYSSVT